MTIVNPGAVSNNTTNVAHKLLVAWVDSQGTAIVGPQGQNIPLAQGGVALSAGANSQSSGTINFSNANGVTFGMDGAGNITATVTPGAAAGIAAAQAGTQTQTSGTLVFSNSNGFSFGMSNSSVITASYTVPSQTNQTVASGNIAGTGFTSTTTAGVVIVGTNNTAGLSLGVPNYLTTYVAQTTQTQPAGNIAGAGTTTTTQGGSTLGATQNSNGLSLAVPLWITTYVGQSTQTQPAGNIAGLGTTTTTQGGSTLGATLSTNGLSLAVPAWLTAAAGGGGFSGGVSNIGNTLGNTGTQTGTLVFAGGNNITLSVATAAGGAQTITISGANAGGAQTGISGIADANGTQTNGTVSFANSNGITFGLSTGANTGTITASYTVPTVTNSSWTVSDHNTSATVALLAFTQSNGMTLSLSTSNNGHHTVIGSYTVPTTAGLISGLNVSGGAGNSQSNVTGMTFNNSNGLTFGVSTGANVVTITGSYTVPSTAGLLSAINVSDSATSENITQLVFSNANNVTFGLSTAGGGPFATITASVLSQSVQTQAAGNIAGIGTTTTTQAGSTLGATLSTNGLSLAIPAWLTVAAGAGAAISAAGSSQNGGTIVFSNSNNVSFGMNGSTITATVTGAGGGGVAIAASNSTFTSGTVVMSAAGGALTISNGAQSALFSVPQTSSIVGTYGNNISTAGSTISVYPATLDLYVNLAAAEGTGSGALTVGSHSNGTLNLFPLNPAPQLFPGLMTVDRLGMLWSASVTNSTQSTQAFSSTFALGIYTQANATKLSRLYSGSFTTQGSANNGNSSLVNGIRWLTIASNSWDTQPVLSVGNYWGGMLALTGGTSWATASNGPVVARAGLSNQMSGIFGSASAGSASDPNRFPFDGYLSVSTAGLPATIALSDVIHTGSGYGQMVPYIAMLGSGKSGAFGYW